VAADGHGIDLDGVGLWEAGQRLEPLQHLAERVATRHREEAVALERVDRDVEPIHAGGHECLRVARQQEAVGRERELADVVDGGQHPGQAREVTAHERLAAGEAHVADAHRRQQRDHALELLEAQHLVALEPRQSLGRHAVLAAEVAAVGDRHAQVADVPAVAVDQGLAGHDLRLDGREGTPGGVVFYANPADKW
jgi:hypothetical protein